MQWLCLYAANIKATLSNNNVIKTNLSTSQPNKSAKDTFKALKINIELLESIEIPLLLAWSYQQFSDRLSKMVFSVKDR